MKMKNKKNDAKNAYHIPVLGARIPLSGVLLRVWRRLLLLAEVKSSYWLTIPHHSSYASQEIKKYIQIIH